MEETFPHYEGMFEALKASGLEFVAGATIGNGARLIPAFFISSQEGMKLPTNIEVLPYGDFYISGPKAIKPGDHFGPSMSSHDCAEDAEAALRAARWAANSGFTDNLYSQRVNPGIVRLSLERICESWDSQI